MSISNKLPIPDMKNIEHNDDAEAKNVVMLGITSGGAYIPIKIDTDGSIMANYLKLDGSNANQNINIGIYGFTADKLNIDNLQIDGNILEATSGDLYLGKNAMVGSVRIGTSGTIYFTAGGRNAYFNDMDVELTNGDLTLTSGNLTVSGISYLNTLTLSSGSITDSTGEISFGDENLTTTGIIKAEHLYSTDDAYVADRLGIGIILPSTSLHIVGTHISGKGIAYFKSDDHAFMTLDSAVSKNAGFFLQENSVNRWLIDYHSSGNYLRFHNYNLERSSMILPDAGGLWFSYDNDKLSFGATDTDLQISSDGTNGIIDVATSLRLGNNVTNYMEVKADGEINLHGTARTKCCEWIDAATLKAPLTKPATYISHGLNGAWSFADAVEVNQETLTIVSTASGTTNGLVIAEITGMDLPSSSDECLYFKVTRLSADGEDTIADTTELLCLCLEYTSNKLGKAT